MASTLPVTETRLILLMALVIIQTLKQ